jgi:hypothetical protein
MVEQAPARQASERWRILGMACATAGDEVVDEAGGAFLFQRWSVGSKEKEVRPCARRVHRMRHFRALACSGKGLNRRAFLPSGDSIVAFGQNGVALASLRCRFRPKKRRRNAPCGASSPRKVRDSLRSRDAPLFASDLAVTGLRVGPPRPARGEKAMKFTG